MREIKFRAWEKNMKEMINVDSIDFERKIINKEFVWRMLSEVVLMQYIGLKDKKGVEIFEGDIVEDYNRNLFTVEYNMFCSFMLYPLKNREKFLAIYPTIELKVVGNIFENPELLLEEN